MERGFPHVAAQHMTAEHGRFGRRDPGGIPPGFPLLFLLDLTPGRYPGRTVEEIPGDLTHVPVPTPNLEAPFALSDYPHATHTLHRPVRQA